MFAKGSQEHECLDGNLCAAMGFGKVSWVSPFGDTILSAEASQERECLGDAFAQESFGEKIFSEEGSQERE